ncbi:hypothetical protein AAFC00_003148 [Neodothiora populina]|uniref:Uncharacterized protein n=1 Tax=Neodothiora populina TaxID=2781224 RepID=A0ABR3P9R3_9PEZI
MIQPCRRTTPLLLLFLFFALLQVSPARGDGADQQVLSQGERASDAAQGSHWEDGYAEYRAGEEGAGKSQAAVQEATAILRKIKPPTSRLSRLSKPTGIIGSSIHYAKELFVLLFMNGPPQPDLLTTSSQPQKLSPALSNAVHLLTDAADSYHDPDAIWLLAEMNFYGNYTHPRDYKHAFKRYSQLASLAGNSSAQYMLGFMYATGIGNAVEQNQAKALLYHSFAAEGGDIRSQMTLAYRHHTGIGTPRNCDEAVHWYRQVADKAVAFYKSGPPGGHSLLKNSYRLADEEGGVYGEGASVSSSGPHAKQGGPTSDAYADLEDVLEYLDFQSRKGDHRATFNLARLYYEGSRGLKRDLPAAKEHFMKVARLYWTKDGRIMKDVPQVVEKLAPKAAGYVGRMFLRGEGMEQSYSKAKIWFQRGIASSGEPLCQYSMGLMYLYGLGVPKDVTKAAEYFAPAADSHLAVAQTELGILFMDQGDLATAKNYFELSARNSHIEAFYYLAEISNQGLLKERSCGVAAVYYKIAAEKAEIIHSPFVEANDAYDDGDLETALVAYMMAAEQGYENAQANVAYLLDNTRPAFSLASFLPVLQGKATAFTDAALALIFWTRSAKQQNIDSLVKMGDYYLNGMGASLSAENAAACYQAAADTLQSAQAMWNLGWMHENGVGMEQDFHLAKRFYDQALETNAEAYLPVKLSLARLHLRSWWNGVSGGKVNSIREEPTLKRKRTLTQWLNDFVEADYNMHPDQYGESDDWGNGNDHDEDSGHMPGVADDFFDEEIDDGLIEMLVIIGLAGALAFLLYYRQQRALAERRRREQEGVAQQQQQGQEDQDGRAGGGFFPPPGDPNFANWIAGGIGH